MSNRNKKILLALVGIVILWLLYRNISNTAQLINEYYTRKSLATESNYDNRSLKDLQQELNAYNLQLGYATQNTVSNQGRLLDFVSEYCNSHKTRISLLPKGQKETKNGYSIETNVVQVEGDFKEIVGMIYLIEQKERLAKVVSSNFELKEDWIAKTKHLYATIYFQNIQAQ